MFTPKRFTEIEPSFRLISSTTNSPEVSTLCMLDDLHDKGMVFVKNSVFYRRLLLRAKSGRLANDLCVVFEESFLDQVKAEVQAELIEHLGWMASVASVDLAISRFSKLFFDEFQAKGSDLVDGRETGTASVDPTSTMADGVFLGEGVEIGAHAVLHRGCVVLSHSKIGSGTVIYPNVVLYRNVSVGKNCIVHANTTIGSDGFGYNYHEGEHLKVWHFGGVRIEDSVEIGSNTSIDQGTFSPTVIGRGSKIDNQVQIAHNCRIGKGVIVCGQIGFSGSVRVGDHVVMGGAAGIAQDVEIGACAQIAGMAGITGNVPAKAVYAGHPARPLREWLRASATLRKLSARETKKS